MQSGLGCRAGARKSKNGLLFPVSGAPLGKGLAALAGTAGLSQGPVGEELDVLKDIREISDEQYWEELRSRWTSLLSYRYIGRNHGGLNAGPVDNTVTLRHDMRNAAGGIMVAPLCISAPESGGFSDSFAVPNPVIQ